MRFIPLVISLFTLLSALNVSAQVSTDERVILITIDGMRWQEFFQNHENPSTSNLPHFWETLANQGVIYGAPGSGSLVTVSNPVNISMPGYQSILAGYQQKSCLDNDCPRIAVETLQERLARESRMSFGEVATFSSWEKIPLAAEHIAGTTFTNGGVYPVPNPQRDPIVDVLNVTQARDRGFWYRPGYDESRYDKYTFLHALQYLKTQHPRFLYLSLNDSDEWAHNGNYPYYTQYLRQFDGWFKELIAYLDRDVFYSGKTTVIVTTDHGRGALGDSWKHHGPGYPEAKYIWLYAIGPHVAPLGIAKTASTHSHADIRPTIEAILGLCPLACEGCGKPLAEVLALNRPKHLAGCK